MNKKDSLLYFLTSYVDSEQRVMLCHNNARNYILWEGRAMAVPDVFYGAHVAQVTIATCAELEPALDIYITGFDNM